ncbi:MAG: type II toxin-antitoxin system VapC family toxin [Alphaproteobacteria bacterium]|nr:type II toxin-antitoxin system VapC family toxin [Alphaproteobacteria bacterium]
MAVLLDTCAIIWLGGGARMSAASIAAINQAAVSGEVFVSPISAWEIGYVHADPRKDVSFQPSPAVWFQAFLLRAGVRLVPITVNAATEAATLPGPIHADPADRLLIATARELGASIVTRDRKILDYGRRGHVDVIAC